MENLQYIEIEQVQFTPIIKRYVKEVNKFSNSTLNVITLCLTITSILIAIYSIDMGYIFPICMFPVLNRLFKSILSMNKDKDYTIFYTIGFSLIQVLVCVYYTYLI